MPPPLFLLLCLLIGLITYSISMRDGESLSRRLGFRICCILLVYWFLRLYCLSLLPVDIMFAPISVLITLPTNSMVSSFSLSEGRNSTFGGASPKSGCFWSIGVIKCRLESGGNWPTDGVWIGLTMEGVMSVCPVKVTNFTLYFVKKFVIFSEPSWSSP